MAEKSISQLFKESLKNKNTYIPNLLTASRLVGAFVVPSLFLTGNIPGAVIATVAFASTDFFDGKIARATNGYSEFGRVLDPIVDKAFAVVPALAILPSVPILALNIGAEAAIGYINAKSYVTNGNPKSSFLGKFKTFCLFPAIGFAYLSTALNIPSLTAFTTAFCLGTLGVQSAAALDYHKKAKQQEKTKQNTETVIEEQKEEDNKTKFLEEAKQYDKVKEKDIQSTQPIKVEESQTILDSIDLDQIPLEQIPGLIEAPVDQATNTPKTFRKTNNKK